MKKPSPESSNLITKEFDEFAESLLPSDWSGTILPPDQIEELKQKGTPLFTEEEVNATADQLNLIFRKLCVDQHITLEYFTEKYKIYAMTKLGKTPQGALNNKTNIVKQLKHTDKITWTRFNELTALVLGIKPEFLKIVFSTPKGSEKIELTT